MTDVTGTTYILPPLTGFNKHCLTKIRRPQYSFGQRIQLKDRKFGPAPIEYNLREIHDSKNRYGYATHTGINYAPEFSCGRTLQDLKKFQTPAPGGIGNLDVTRYAQPKYSCRRRLLPFRKMTIPAPNEYSKYGDQYKRILDRPPVYTMRKRVGIKELIKSPGPATYPGTGGSMNTNIYKIRRPTYKIGERLKPLKGTTQIPGPDQYVINPIIFRKAPEYSLGIKLSKKMKVMITECDNF